MFAAVAVAMFAPAAHAAPAWKAPLEVAPDVDRIRADTSAQGRMALQVDTAGRPRFVARAPFGAFSPLSPFPSPVDASGAGYSKFAFFPDGSAIVAWSQDGTNYAQFRRANGTFAGTRQTLSGCGGGFDIAASTSGAALLVYSSGGSLGCSAVRAALRPAGESSTFDLASPKLIDDSSVSGFTQPINIQAVLDPDGKASAIWTAGEEGQPRQSSKAAATSAAWNPATDVGPTSIGTVLRMEHNAAGRSLAVWGSGTVSGDDTAGQWYASLREPGGTFASGTSFSNSLYSFYDTDAPRIAVDTDGRAVALADGYEIKDCAQPGFQHVNIWGVQAPAGQGLSPMGNLAVNAFGPVVALRGGRSLFAWSQNTSAGDLCAEPPIGEYMTRAAVVTGSSPGTLPAVRNGFSTHLAASLDNDGNGVVAYRNSDDFNGYVLRYEGDPPAGPGNPSNPGGGSTQPPGNTTPPPAPIVAPKFAKGAKPKLSGKGLVQFTFSNLNPFPVTGSAVLSSNKAVASRKAILKLGRKSFSIPANGKRKLKIKLSRKNLRKLRKLKRLKVKLVVTTKAAGHATDVVTLRFTLKAPRAK